MIDRTIAYCGLVCTDWNANVDQTRDDVALLWFYVVDNGWG
jgi:hypothetical protein